MIKEWILAKLLASANSKDLTNQATRALFYKIKNMLLDRFGKVTGQHLQFINGKRCFSCEGTGIYQGRWGPEKCYNCHGGWYSRSFWSVLNIVGFGGKEFHQPVRRIFDAAELIGLDLPTKFHGYIKHKPRYWSDTSLIILFWLYCPSYLAQHVIGWPCSNSPKYLLRRVSHLLIHGTSNLRFQFRKWDRRQAEKMRRWLGIAEHPRRYYVFDYFED